MLGESEVWIFLFSLSGKMILPAQLSSHSLTPRLDLGIGFFEQRPLDLEWNSNFILRVLITWGMVKQVVLQTAREKSVKPLTGNRHNKMRCPGHGRRRQEWHLTWGSLWLPLQMGLSRRTWMPKKHSGFWSGEGSGYVAGVTWTWQKQF